jgi:P2-related tail formation protein
MILLSDSPTLNEWIAIIQHDADQAQQLLLSLRAQIKQQNLMAAPALTISAENYERAQQLLAAAMHDPQQTEKIAQRAALGHATLASLPNREEWRQLFQTDASFAHALHQELQLKQAQMGLSTPRALQASIDAYRSIFAELSTNS